MKKHLTMLGVCLMCLLFLPDQLRAQQIFRAADAEISEVQKVVAESRNHWLHMFPAEELPEFGFRDQREKERAVAGSPIEVYHMYRTFKGTTEIKASGEFLIPLMVDGKTRVFLTVAFHEGYYQVVSAGEMNLALAAAPYLRETDRSSKTRMIWLKDLNQTADFIAEYTPAKDDSGVIFSPLFTAERASFTEPLPLKNIVARIQHMIVEFD